MDSLDIMSVPEFEELSVNPVGAMLWDHLVSCLHGQAEVEYIRGALDDNAVVKPNEYARDELKSLLQILGDLRSEADRKEVAQRLKPMLSHSNKEMLERQLRSLLEQVKVASTQEIASTPREKMIVEYVANNSRRPSSAMRLVRPGSARSVCNEAGRLSSTPGMSEDSRPTSASTSTSLYADPMKNLAPLHRHLRFDKVNTIIPQLKDLFVQEHNALLEDIQYIRDVIDEELKWARFAEPTPNELKSLSEKLSETERDNDHVAKILSLPSTSKRRLPSLGPNVQ